MRRNTGHLEIVVVRFQLMPKTAVATEMTEICFAFYIFPFLHATGAAVATGAMYIYH